MASTRTSQIPKVNHKPGSLEAAPALSLFAMDGWACSRVPFSLRKERDERRRRSAYEKVHRSRKTKATMSKKLTPQGEQLASRRPDRWASSHPASGPKLLEGRRWPWHGSSRLAGARTGAPAASLSFLGGRGATASQWPRRLGPSMTALPRRRGRARRDLTSLGRRRGIGPRAVRSARTLLWSLRLGGIDVASRRTLEDSVKA